MMVDFKEYSARLESSDQAIACTFDDDTATSIASFLRQSVYAIGITTRQRADNVLVELHIKQLFLMLGAIPTEAMQAALVAYRAENDTVENIRRGFIQALRGETRSLEDIWSELNAE